ncbi:hypothetical protein [Pseudomonas mandelii]|uniref:hypothetical protein n=1 Tax=Pseudomonas mandelii TaxID=75612 RepID=UPI00036E3940|nr:hypothetical protein [Pseudomonas mandelii]
MKNLLLFVFGTLAIVFGASTVLLVTKPEYVATVTRNWQAPSETPSPIASERSIKGQVFVVTRGGSSVPLGGVVVSIYTHKTIQSLLPPIYQRMAIDVLRYSTAYMEIKDKEGVAYADFDKIKNKNNTWNDKQSKAYDAYKKLTKEKMRNYYSLMSITSGESYYAALPSPYISVQTDASGYFKANISGSSVLVATACASRQIGDTKERYCWFIKTDGGQDVLMNNNNMFGMGSSDSAIQMPELPVDCLYSKCDDYISNMRNAYQAFFSSAR